MLEYLSSIHHDLAGPYHRIVDGQLFLEGPNNYGQLGLGDHRVRYEFTAVILPESVIAVSCGLRHTIAITSSGCVYGTGIGLHGRLGGHDDQSTFVMLPTPVKMVSCGTGWYHTVLLSSQGQVYVCGGNRHGQLGLGNQVDEVSVLTQVQLPYRVASIHAEVCQTTIVTSTGKTYSVGYQLGQTFG